MKIEISLTDAIASAAAARRIVIAIGSGYVCIGNVHAMPDGSLRLIPALPLTYKEVPIHAWEPSEDNKI